MPSTPDVPLACHCFECAGAEVPVSDSKMTYLLMLDQAAQDRITHDLVSRAQQESVRPTR